MTPQDPGKMSESDAEFLIAVGRSLGADGRRRMDSIAASLNPQAPAEPERAIRRILCAAVAGPLAYMDDGEAQSSEHGGIDFLTASASDIEAWIVRKNVAAFQAPVVAQAFPALPESNYRIGIEGNGYGSEDRITLETAYTEEDMHAYVLADRAQRAADAERFLKLGALVAWGDWAITAGDDTSIDDVPDLRKKLDAEEVSPVQMKYSQERIDAARQAQPGEKR